MNEWARVFTEQIAAGAGGVGVALIAALFFFALSHITLPTFRNLWRKATPFGRVIGAVLFLVCSINATTKAPRRVPARTAASVAKSHSERFENWFRRGAWRDVRFVKFDSDWVFPLGMELALFPEETEVTWECIS